MPVSLQWEIAEKGFWHQQLDETSSFLTTFNTELGRFWFTVMASGATVPGDVFQYRLDECFGKLEQVNIIADNIMVVGYKPDHSSPSYYKLQKSAMPNSTMTSSSTSKMKWSSLVRCT